MNKNNPNNIEELFRQGLLDQQQAYSDHAWERMREKLDEDDKVVLTIIPKRNKKNNIIIMSIVTLLTTAALIAIGQGENRKNSGLEGVSDQKNLKTVQPSADSKEGDLKESTNVPTVGNVNTHFAAGMKNFDSGQPVFEKAKPSSKAGVGTIPAAIVAEFAKNKPEENVMEEIKQNSEPIAQKPAIKKSSDSTTRPVVKKSDYTFRDGFIGIHYTSQHALTPALKDSDRYNAGFNIQLMSRNLLPASPFGGYLGLDWGMQFYGKGNKTNVQLNTNNGDSGWTRLSTFSMDFFARGHIEYARYKLIPYVNFFAGPRFYSTNQKVQSYIPLANTESSDLINAATSMSFMTGAGAGLRWRISDVVSLDARFDWMSGSNAKIVDLDKSSFNGLSYNLVKKSVTPEYYQVKFGVLFNLGDDENYEPATNTQTTYREPQYIFTQPTYQYFDSSTNTWKELPMCPCNCDSTGKKISPTNIRRVTPKAPAREYKRTEDNETQPQNRPPAGSGSSPAPTGKGSFPGIKPSGSGGKIKS